MNRRRKVFRFDKCFFVFCYRLDHRSDEMAQWPKLSAHVPSLFSKTKSDMITYEDLLVHQYLENIKREKRDSVQEKQ